MTIEAALRLAQAKFGDQLKLSGSAEFQERAALIAAEAGLTVRFDNQHAEEVRQRRAVEMISVRAIGRPVVEARAVEPPKAGKSATVAQHSTLGRGGRRDNEKEIER
jgi:hypothetical protein